MDRLSEISVTAKPGARTGRLTAGDHTFPCAIGRTGLAGEKREGDGGTPIGTFPLRELRYRQDRMSAPDTGLPLIPIGPKDGWCDASADPAYNRPVDFPYTASAEQMWRDDHLYDLVIVVGYNDDPVVPEAGSAIFIHLAKEENGELQPTQGCVALRLDDMLALLARIDDETTISISA